MPARRGTSDTRTAERRMEITDRSDHQIKTVTAREPRPRQRPPNLGMTASLRLGVAEATMTGRQLTMRLPRPATYSKRPVQAHVDARQSKAHAYIHIGESSEAVSLHGQDERFPSRLSQCTKRSMPACINMQESGPPPTSARAGRPKARLDRSGSSELEEVLAGHSRDERST
jgi:hypothetical protein